MLAVNQAELTLAIIEKLLIYGPKVVIELAGVFEKKEVTIEDIKSLIIDKEPEEYFNAK